MRNLSSPFDQSEYYRLMQLATAKKPVVKYKHLRTDDIPYETEQLGLSYFDYYPGTSIFYVTFLCLSFIYCCSLLQCTSLEIKIGFLNVKYYSHYVAYRF